MRESTLVFSGPTYRVRHRTNEAFDSLDGRFHRNANAREPLEPAPC